VARHPPRPMACASRWCALQARLANQNLPRHLAAARPHRRANPPWGCRGPFEPLSHGGSCVSFGLARNRLARPWTAGRWRWNNRSTRCRFERPLRVKPGPAQRRSSRAGPCGRVLAPSMRSSSNLDDIRGRPTSCRYNFGEARLYTSSWRCRHPWLGGGDETRPFLLPRAACVACLVRRVRTTHPNPPRPRHPWIWRESFPVERPTDHSADFGPAGSRFGERDISPSWVPCGDRPAAAVLASNPPSTSWAQAAEF